MLSELGEEFPQVWGLEPGDVTFDLDEDMRLVMTCDQETREELKEWFPGAQDQWGIERAEWELLEPVLCNGWDLVHPEQLDALTGTYFIGFVLGDDWPEEPYTEAELWAFSSYAVRSWIEDLINHGRAVWDFHEYDVHTRTLTEADVRVLLDVLTDWKDHLNFQVRYSDGNNFKHFLQQCRYAIELLEKAKRG